MIYSLPQGGVFMAHLIEMDDYRPEPLKHEDGQPAGIPGLVYWQDHPVPLDALPELEIRLINVA
jgi:hypothetical protein